MSKVRDVITVSHNDKKNFIVRHIDLFHRVSIYLAGTGYPRLNSEMKLIATIIRSEFNYSRKTGDYDLVVSWIRTYKENLIHFDKMSKKFNHETLELRIRRVFADSNHEKHHQMLRDIFPEIYEEMRAAEWNNIHKVGHIYARLTKDQDYVTSLLMPVIIPGGQHSEPHHDEIAVLNLIAGNFWKDIVTHPHGTMNNHYDINDEDWNHLFKSHSGETLIHIGRFDHGASNIYMQGKHNTVGFFKILDK